MYTYQELKRLFGVENAKTDKDIQKEFSEHFFYANVCQYCTNFGEGVPVKRCQQCDGMFYCSAEHSSLHWIDHKEFCHALKKLKLTAQKKYLFQDYYMGDLGKRTHFIELAEIKLGRKLKPFEQNMFLFPRVCLYCYESNPGLVKSCPNCPHANFCIKHLNDISYHSDANCKLFIYVFYLDQHWIVFKDLPLERFVHALPRNKKVIQLPSNIIAFIDEFVVPYQRNLNFNNEEVKTLVSTVFTRTLTLIYALQKLNLTFCSQLVVHVMSKAKFVEENFAEWEILLHWFPRLKFLKICFIGCQMLSHVLNLRLCAHCKSKTLKIEISNLVYKEYYKISRRNPDIIVAYNVDINNHCTWTDASSLLTSLNTPILLTALCESYLNTAARDCVINPNNFSRIEINPFESLKAERFLHHISFSNHLISIYGNVFPKLCGVDDPIDPCNDCNDCEIRESSKIVWERMLHEQEEFNKSLKKKVKLFETAIQILKERQNVYEKDFEIAKMAIANTYFVVQEKVTRVLQNLQFAEELESLGIDDVK